MLLHYGYTSEFWRSAASFCLLSFETRPFGGYFVKGPTRQRTVKPVFVKVLIPSLAIQGSDMIHFEIYIGLWCVLNFTQQPVANWSNLLADAIMLKFLVISFIITLKF